jgi:hypothetical protein
MNCPNSEEIIHPEVDDNRYDGWQSNPLAKAKNEEQILTLER